MAANLLHIIVWAMASVSFVHIVHTMTTHTGDIVTTEATQLISSTGQSRQTTSKECDTGNGLAICMIDRSRCLMGKCYINKAICEVLCRCLSGFDGDRCQYRLGHNHTLSSTASTDQNQTIATSTAENNGSTTPTTKEGCLNDKTCVHGTCVVDEIHKWCNCTKGWIGVICTTKCDLDCVNGLCMISATDHQMDCNCYYGYIGDYCEIKHDWFSNHTDTETLPADQRYIAGVVLGAIVVLGIIAVVMCWVLWKRRVRILLRLIYWAKPYEDDDFKRYDAFLSFKSSTSDEMHQSSPEELFVMQTLMSKLEGELGFRLCVHFRDFIPGKAIVENVLEAIENSRRTILLLSPSYIKDSFWTRFEYEQAQVAAMERKQRIIPIIFEDISEIQIEDITLRHILKSITYIKWPGYEDEKKLDEFWERLTLTMPKLLSTNFESEENTPQAEEKVDQGNEDPVLAKTSISNGPYITPGTDSESIALEMSDNKIVHDNETDQVTLDNVYENACRLFTILEPTA